MSYDSKKNIEDYLEDACELHNDLLHGMNGRRAFAKLRTDDHITEITGQGTENIVVIAGMNGRRIGDIDEKRIRRGVEVMFAVKASQSGNAGVAIRIAIDKAEEIMLDFVSKMENDLKEACDIEFDLENISWDEIDGPWLDNYYGWMLFLPFKGYFPEYDADKWAGLPSTPLPDVIVYVDRFRVGSSGAPMNEGSTTYTNSELAGSLFLILADGKAIHQNNEIPGERYASKPFESDTITINGGVSHGEVIEIYKVA